MTTVADVRLHGTTHERPADRLATERSSLGPMPAHDRLATFLREKRTVGRDGYVQWGRSWYGVPCQWASLRPGDRPVAKEPLAVQIPSLEVERRPLTAYESLLGVAGR